MANWTIQPDPSLNQGEPFEVTDTLTVVEAALVYAGRHPYTTLGGKDAPLAIIKRWIKAVARHEEGEGSVSSDVYHSLLRSIDRGEIKPVKPGFLDNGEMDPRSTLIRTADLIALAQQRGDAAPELFQLQPNSETQSSQTELSGPSISIRAALFTGRKDSGQALDGLADEARAVHDIVKKQYPHAIRDLKTFTNHLGQLRKQWKEDKTSRK